jgi:ribonuclease Z
LKAIWISHYHLDHVAGLVRLLLERRAVTSESLVVCYGDVLKQELQRIEKHWGEGAFNIVYHDRLTPIEAAGTLIESVPVCHCSESMGCVMTMRGGERLAFSGDRISDGEFERVVRSCDVLIHEGTYTADLQEQARARGHSTLADALAASAALNAKWLVVVHISWRTTWQRTDLPEANAIVAFDHLSLAFEEMEEGFRIAKERLRKGIEDYAQQKAKAKAPKE